MIYKIIQLVIKYPYRALFFGCLKLYKSPIIETHGIANPDYDLSKATALEEENKGLYFKAQEYSEKMKIKFLFKFTYYIK